MPFAGKRDWNLLKAVFEWHADYRKTVHWGSYRWEKNNQNNETKANFFIGS